MQALNLPTYPFKLKEESGKHKIFDPIRRKYLILTPEEWVRQHFIQYLILEKKFPAGLFKIEVGVAHHQKKGRFDALVTDRQGQPLMLIECKAPSVVITKETFYQIARYNTEMEVPYFAVTNGLQHYYFKLDRDAKKLNFLEDLPEYQYLV